MATLRNRNGDRVGYASRDREGRSTRYTVGSDLGNPNRTAMDREYNTPFGTFGYGYDGNTDYLSYQTPYIQNYGNGANLMSGGERVGFVNRNMNGGTPTYGIGVDMGNPNRTAYDNAFNTPFGAVGYGYDGNTNYANFTPNAYVMALANLLSGR